MIQQKTTLTRPSADVPWHWDVINRNEHARNLEENYISKGKILTQYEEIPNELTSVWYRFWDNIESYNAYLVDPKVMAYDAAAKSYNDFAGIVISPAEITQLN